MWRLACTVLFLFLLQKATAGDFIALEGHQSTRWSWSQQSVPLLPLPDSSVGALRGSFALPFLAGTQPGSPLASMSGSADQPGPASRESHGSSGSLQAQLPMYAGLLRISWVPWLQVVSSSNVSAASWSLADSSAAGHADLSATIQSSLAWETHWDAVRLEYLIPVHNQSWIRIGATRWSGTAAFAGQFSGNLQGHIAADSSAATEIFLDSAWSGHSHGYWRGTGWGALAALHWRWIELSASGGAEIPLQGRLSIAHKVPSAAQLVSGKPSDRLDDWIQAVSLSEPAESISQDSAFLEASDGLTMQIPSRYSIAIALPWNLRLRYTLWQGRMGIQGIQDSSSALDPRPAMDATVRPRHSLDASWSWKHFFLAGGGTAVNTGKNSSRILGHLPTIGSGNTSVIPSLSTGAWLGKEIRLGLLWDVLPVSKLGMEALYAF